MTAPGQSPQDTEAAAQEIGPVRNEVFISYSHKDEKWLGDLITHLTPYIRNRRLNIWHDGSIDIGGLWKKEIEQALSRAKVAVLLVTPHFLASDFIAKDELPPLLDAAKREGLKIFWIAVRASAYEETVLTNIQAANNPDHPLESLSEPECNREWVRICKRIAAAGATVTPPTPPPPPEPYENNGRQRKLSSSQLPEGQGENSGRQSKSPSPPPPGGQGENSSIQEEPHSSRLLEIRDAILNILKINAILVGLLLIVLLILDYVGLFPPTNVIKIVSSLPYYGLSELRSRDIEDGIRQALQEHCNKAAGYEVKYIPLNDAGPNGQWEVAKEVENAKQAVNDRSVMVYIGPFNSGAAVYSMPILNREGLPMISPSNTAPELTKKGFDDELYNTVHPTEKRTYFRLVPTDDIQGKQASDWAKSLRFGLSKAYVIDDGEPYGKTIADVFAKQFDGIRSTVYTQSIDFRNTDADTLDKARNTFEAGIQKHKPELVYFGGNDDNGKWVLEALRTVDPNGEIKFMGPDTIRNQAFIDKAGVIAEGTLATMPGKPYKEYGALGEQKGKEFYDTFKREHDGREPDQYAIYGYEAMMLALHAIERADTNNRDAIRTALLCTKDYEGALGTWSFDEHGDITQGGISLYEVKYGKFEVVKYKQMDPGTECES